MGALSLPGGSESGPRVCADGVEAGNIYFAAARTRFVRRGIIGMNNGDLRFEERPVGSRIGMRGPKLVESAVSDSKPTNP